MLSSWAGLCPPQGHTQSRRSKASTTLTSQSAGRRRRRPDEAPSSPHRQGCCAEAPRKLGGKTEASRCPQHLCPAWTLEAAGTWGSHAHPHAPLASWFGGSHALPTCTRFQIQIVCIVVQNLFSFLALPHIGCVALGSLTSLCFIFLICKWEKIVPTSQDQCIDHKIIP